MNGDAIFGDMFKAVIFRHESNAIEFESNERVATRAYGIIPERLEDWPAPSLFDADARGTFDELKAGMKEKGTDMCFQFGDREAS